jgi:DNA-repair protein complementing XP-A cells
LTALTVIHSLKSFNLQTLLFFPITRGAIALTDKNVINQNGRQYVDSGGGFLIEKITNPEGEQFKGGDEDDELFQNLQVETVEVPINYVECLECADKFGDSYLLNNFKYEVCDKCRDNEEKHVLITRTEAKDQYLLKDCDIDRREPPLMYISRKNPHNPRWGEMKLYLHVQIKERAMEVWGSEEAIEEQHELRVIKAEKSKLKKYNKQIKELRMVSNEKTQRRFFFLYVSSFFLPECPQFVVRQDHKGQPSARMGRIG